MRGLFIDPTLFSHQLVKMSSTLPAEYEIVEGASPYQVALAHAKKSELSIGSLVEVSSETGAKSTYEVVRSARSRKVVHGGEVQLVRVPEGLQLPSAREREFTIHAMHPHHAATMFAREMGLQEGESMTVTDAQGREHSYTFSSIAE